MVRANGTFNAWVVGERPEARHRRHVSLVRDIKLDDDMKEYWGFYLLEGSSVTVSPCARSVESSRVEWRVRRINVAGGRGRTTKRFNWCPRQ